MSRKIKLTKGLIFSALILLICIFIMACQNSKTTGIQNSENSRQIFKANSEKSPDVFLSSPTETFKTAFVARQKKDVSSLKQTLSKSTLEFYAKIGANDKKSLDDVINELVQKPQAATAEVRNEKISDNRATIEYLDEHGKWQPLEFIKEGADWKILPQTDNDSKKSNRKN